MGGGRRLGPSALRMRQMLSRFRCGKKWVTAKVRSSREKRVALRGAQTMARSSSVAFQGSLWVRTEWSRQSEGPRWRHICEWFCCSFRSAGRARPRARRSGRSQRGRSGWYGHSDGSGAWLTAVPLPRAAGARTDAGYYMMASPTGSEQCSATKQLGFLTVGGRSTSTHTISWHYRRTAMTAGQT
jgi:hypothetical protein